LTEWCRTDGDHKKGPADKDDFTGTIPRAMPSSQGICGEQRQVTVKRQRMLDRRMLDGSQVRSVLV
jgi:hypothetical protein